MNLEYLYTSGFDNEFVLLKPLILFTVGFLYHCINKHGRRNSGCIKGDYMKCNFCGNEISETDKFCNNCGGPVSRVETVAVPAVQAARQSEAGFSTAPQEENIQKPSCIDKTNVQAIIILVLSIVCCCAGMFFFFNAPFSIVAFILAIISLVKSSKANKLWYLGERRLAADEAKTVKKLNKAGWILFACAAFVCIVIFVLVLAFGQVSFEYYEDFFTMVPYSTEFNYYFN